MQRTAGGIVCRSLHMRRCTDAQPNSTDLSVRTGAGGYNPPSTGAGNAVRPRVVPVFAALILLVLLVFAVGQKFTTEIQIGGVTIHVSLGEPYGRIVSFLLDGVLVTLKLTIVSFVCHLVVGTIGGLGRVSGNRIIGGMASLYVEIVRGIPVLVWLLWIWFALPQLLQTLGGLAPKLPAIGQWLVNIRLSHSPRRSSG